MAKNKSGASSKPEVSGKVADQLVDAVIEEYESQLATGGYYGMKLDRSKAGKAILTSDRTTQAELVPVALDRLDHLEEKIAEICAKPGNENNPHHDRQWNTFWSPRWVLLKTLELLLRRTLQLEEDAVVRLLRWPVEASNGVSRHVYPLSGIAKAAENFVEGNGLSARLSEALTAFLAKLGENDNDHECRKTAARMRALVAGSVQLHVQPGEAWSDAALADLKAMNAKPAKTWNALLLHCQTGGKGKFTDRWRKAAEPLIDAVTFASLKEHTLRWFPLVDKPRTQPIERRHQWAPDDNNLIIAPHVELLRGLVWCCGLKEDADLARAIAKLAISAYRKIPQKGPRLVSLGNACITALGMMPGLPPIGQLAILKVKVKFGTAQKEIEKAFNTAAAREGLPRDEIEELAVPAYGLEEIGVLREQIGDYRAELLVDGSSAALHWFKNGKPLKSAPAAAKKEFPAECKELAASVKDINAMLPAQRERLDMLFLGQKTWPLAIWKERYLDHPLVGTIARRMIWSFATGSKTTDGIWHGDRLVNADDMPLKLAENTTVSLWHPIGRPMDDILTWRSWLERSEVVQPFKQAHREVYILTDAERNTSTYSNRFAAHILRQHQFNALCLARGWKNKLRLMVDDSYAPPHRLLPQWGLRAEFWVEGIGSEYGSDTNETGVFLYLATDQVRFYHIDAAQMQAHAAGGGYGPGWNRANADPLPLTEIPPLVFSEIMRDVDLFVGVASVGNDPNWSDGGPNGRYVDYWQSYSFGELSATAQTRKALLERLVPRLKIADRCSISDRFLNVRGSIRNYKIHLGSGNILMEPNDQYLCIVPKQSVAMGERVHLPFEGDNTLSIILSKAFLLAEDAKIKDPTITSQLKR